MSLRLLLPGVKNEEIEEDLACFNIASFNNVLLSLQLSFNDFANSFTWLVNKHVKPSSKLDRLSTMPEKLKFGIYIYIKNLYNISILYYCIQYLYQILLCREEIN